MELSSQALHNNLCMTIRIPQLPGQGFDILFKERDALGFIRAVNDLGKQITERIKARKPVAVLPFPEEDNDTNQEA